jgi:hypothetical protein
MAREIASFAVLIGAGGHNVLLLCPDGQSVMLERCSIVYQRSLMPETEFSSPIVLTEEPWASLFAKGQRE